MYESNIESTKPTNQHDKHDMRVYEGLGLMFQYFVFFGWTLTAHKTAILENWDIESDTSYLLVRSFIFCVFRFSIIYFFEFMTYEGDHNSNHVVSVRIIIYCFLIYNQALIHKCFLRLHSRSLRSLNVVVIPIWPTFKFTFYYILHVLNKNLYSSIFHLRVLMGAGTKEQKKIYLTLIKGLIEIYWHLDDNKSFLFFFSCTVSPRVTLKRTLWSV